MKKLLFENVQSEWYALLQCSLIRVLAAHTCKLLFKPIVLQLLFTIGYTHLPIFLVWKGLSIVFGKANTALIFELNIIYPAPDYGLTTHWVLYHSDGKL